MGARGYCQHSKRGQKVRPAVSSALTSLYRIGLISTAGGGKTFAWRRAA
ncbi:hypothetical protein [Sinorhizobium alkalisoli]|nr:hypothetical protein [Sinorhizobium alkalisoli]MCG5479485.1 hypothetical protein [Sinorhizobium alkalisoli]